MNKITIDIQGGFTANKIILFVNDIHIWNTERATSNLSTEFIKDFDVQYYLDSELYIKVIVDDKEFSMKVLDKNIKYIGIERTNDGNIKFNSSIKPFYYD